MRLLLIALGFAFALTAMTGAAFAQRSGWDDPPIDQDVTYAVVAAGPSGEVGFAYDYPTREAAIADAMQGCAARGFISCRVIHEASGPGVCVAIARDEETGAPFVASSDRCTAGVPLAAQNTALEACREAGGEGSVCLIYSAFCHRGLGACISRGPDVLGREELG